MVMITIAIFILVCYSSDAQISGVARLQPHPLKSESLQPCCGLLEGNGRPDELTAVDLLDCVNSSASVKWSFRNFESGGLGKKVALLTYMSPEMDVSRHFAVPDILEYGAYHAANTAIYAEHNHMLYRIATEDVGGNNEPADVRWNKVKLLRDALDPVNGWAKDTEFIVWLDADAIVLDIGFSVEAVGEQFPNAHFIASADIRQGYINSGFLILRNTPWARTFLKDWWEISNRAEVCDQDAFDAVYTRYTVLEREARRTSADAREVLDDENGRVEERVRILRRDALNSDPPATLRQRDYNQVLHLMGESTLMRKNIFKEAFHTSCRTLLADPAEHEYLPSQLGQSQSRLFAHALALYRDDTRDRLGNLTALLDLVTFPAPAAAGGGAEAGNPSNGNNDDTFRVARDQEALIKDSVAAVERAPFLFEGLGRSAHHLCDLLASPSAFAASSNSGSGGNDGGDNDNYEEGALDDIGGQCASVALREALGIRRELFDLAVRWLDVTSAYLNGVNGLIRRMDRDKKDDKELKDYALTLRQCLNHGILSFLHLLKRGAEAGNDLFGAVSPNCHFPPTSTRAGAGSSGQSGNEEPPNEEIPPAGAAGVGESGERNGGLVWARQKLIVSEKVFALLRELDARVSEESKHIPRHMRALMHQNVAYLHYTVAEHHGGPQNSDSDSDSDSDSGSRSGAGGGLRDYHLYQAEQHALSSVHVFDSTYGDSYKPHFGTDTDDEEEDRRGHLLMQADRSTNEEHALSLQILAAIYCTDQRNMSLGISMWERTIAKARDNLQGVSLGKPMERLADIYHNAAVCHLHAAAAQTTPSSSGSDGGRDRLFERANTLANKAVQARTQLQSAAAVPSAAQAAVPAHRPSLYRASDATTAADADTETKGDDASMLQLSVDLLETISRKRALFAASSFSSSSSTSSSSSGEEGREREKEGDLSSLRYLSELDEDEWEECEVGEEGCEAFIVDTDTDMLAEEAAEPPKGGAVEVGGKAGDTSDEEQDEEQEDDEDVQAARKRYASQIEFLSS